MASISFSMVTEVPQVFMPYTAYLVSGNPGNFEMIVVGGDVQTPRRLSQDVIMGAVPANIPADVLPEDTVQNAIYTLRNQIEMTRINSPGTVLKKPTNMNGPCIVKTLPSVAYVKAGVVVDSPSGTFRVNADVEVESLDDFDEGRDYDVYVAPDQTAFCINAGTVPPVSVHKDSVLIGGFHYSCIPYDTDLADGRFQTSPDSTGMIWTQQDLDNILGINIYSIWDLNYRPACSPRGMTCVRSPDGRAAFWFDIYLTGFNPTQTGTSAFGVALGTAAFPPVVPPMFLGKNPNYMPFNWYSASEIGVASGKHLMNYQEFSAAAFGVNENESLGMSDPEVPANALFAPGFTSKWGGIQMTGVIWVWGGNTIVDPSGLWVEGDRGDFHGTPRSVRFGGAYNLSVNSGSQCVSQTESTLEAVPNTGARFSAPHIDSHSPYR